MTLTDDLAAIAVRPGEPGYEAASTTYMGTGAPDVVLRPTTSEQVAAGIALAGSGRPLSVRSGGHSALGFGTNDAGVVIDLSRFDEIELVDRATGLVRVGSGATWGAVAAALAPHGLALTSGDTTSVGVGGLALSGGMGWMLRKHGLTIDAVRAVEVVTVDGRTLRASADEHTDLFWALRGGGGNFGVVTRFELQAAPVTSVVAGTIGFAPDDVPTLVRGYRDAMRTAPDDLTTALLLMPGMGEWPAGVSVFCCWAGADEAAAAEAIAPLRALATPLSDDVRPQPYADVLEEAHPPPDVRALVSNALFRELDDEVVHAVAGHYAAGTAGRVLFIRALGGAMARVPSGATAWAHRDVEAMVVHASFVPTDSPEEVVEAAMVPGRALDRLGCGAYAGFLGTAGPEEVARIFPTETLARLRRVKRTYDPTNLLRLNFNVLPDESPTG